MEARLQGVGKWWESSFDSQWLPTWCTKEAYKLVEVKVHRPRLPSERKEHVCMTYQSRTDGTSYWHQFHVGDTHSYKYQIFSIFERMSESLQALL